MEWKRGGKEPPHSMYSTLFFRRFSILCLYGLYKRNAADLGIARDGGRCVRGQVKSHSVWNYRENGNVGEGGNGGWVRVVAKGWRVMQRSVR